MSKEKQEIVKQQVNDLTADLSATEIEAIFYDVLFRKKVEEGLKQADAGEVRDWNEFKKEIRSWYR